MPVATPRWTTNLRTKNIQKFITQKKFLEATEASLPIYKERIKTVEDLYKILQAFQIDFQKEDFARFMEVKNKDNNIGSDIMSKNDSMTKHQEQLSKLLKNQLIPVLMNEAKRLNEEVIKPEYLSEKSDKQQMVEELTVYAKELDTLKDNAKAYANLRNRVPFGEYRVRQRQTTGVRHPGEEGAVGEHQGVGRDRGQVAE